MAQDGEQPLDAEVAQLQSDSHALYTKMMAVVLTQCGPGHHLAVVTAAEFVLMTAIGGVCGLMKRPMPNPVELRRDIQLVVEKWTELVVK